MYPDLSYFFHDLFGTAQDNWTSIFKSFGLMLGLAFLACGWLLKSELMRLEKEGKLSPFNVKVNKNDGISDILFNAAILAVLIAKVPYVFSHFTEFKADPASIIFSKLGSWPLGILVGAVAGYYFYYEKNKAKSSLPDEITVHPYQKTTDIIIIAALSGVIGARLFSVLENLDDFFRDPMGQLFSGSGLTVYGGIILAFITVYWYIKKNGIKPVYMMDIAGMGILLGYAIGRIGCQVAGDGDWGIVAAAQPSWWFLPDWLWSYHYPNNVSNEGALIAGCDETAFLAAKGSIEARCQSVCGIRYCHEIVEKVYPTPLYETILSLLGFGILYSLRHKIKVAGTLFFLYMIYNGIERFFIENIRVNEKYDYFGMHFSQAQYISILFVIIGLSGAIYLNVKNKDTKTT